MTKLFTPKSRIETDPRRKPPGERTQLERDYLGIGLHAELEKLMRRYGKNPELAEQLGFMLVQEGQRLKPKPVGLTDPEGDTDGE